VVPCPCVAEADYLLGTRSAIGPDATDEVMGYMASRELYRIDHLQLRIQDPGSRILDPGSLAANDQFYNLGLTDAAVIATGEELRTTLLATLNCRHICAIQPLHAAYFNILP